MSNIYFRRARLDYAPPADSGSSSDTRANCHLSITSNHFCKNEILSRFEKVHLTEWLACPSGDYPPEKMSNFLAEEITEKQFVDLYFYDLEKKYQHLFGLVYQTSKTNLMKQVTDMQFGAIVKDTQGQFCFSLMEWSEDDIVGVQTYSFDIPVFCKNNDPYMTSLITPEERLTGRNSPTIDSAGSIPANDKYTWIRFKIRDKQELASGARTIFQGHLPEVIIFSTDLCLESIALVEHLLLLRKTCVILLPSASSGQSATKEGVYDVLERRHNLDMAHLEAPLFQIAENARHLRSIATSIVLRICQLK